VDPAVLWATNPLGYQEIQVEGRLKLKPDAMKTLMSSSSQVTVGHSSATDSYKNENDQTAK
jgi:hypothetical protein